MTKMNELNVKIEAAITNKLGAMAVEIEKMRVIMDEQAATIQSQREAIEILKKDAGNEPVFDFVDEHEEGGIENGQSKRALDAIQ